MKTITLLYKSLLFFTALISFQGFSQNLLNNGDFDLGYNVGFQGGQSPAYNYLAPPYTGTTSAGSWAIHSDSQSINNTSFNLYNDHTNAAVFGNMMIVDGTNTGGQQRFWKAGNSGGGICGLTVGGTYTFSYWIRSIFNSTGGTLANIGVQFNNASSITLVSGSTTAPPVVNNWQKVTYTFTATNSCVNIELYNNNTDFVGNDFAIDDLSLIGPPNALALTYSYTNTSCAPSSDGTITAYAKNGTPPYLIYNLTGDATQSNTTGFFTGLPMGTYNISVTDTAGATIYQTDIFIYQPPGLLISRLTDIMCDGDVNEFHASQGSTGYTWTASPPDPSLITPNSADISVTPHQTTFYTVTSTKITTVDLVTNSVFSNDNIGFFSDYTYISNNPTSSQKTYGIVSNPNAWEAGFSASCTGLTGTGKMMVVDGSTANAGNDVVWGEKIPVNPGQNYSFTFFAQSLTSSNPASIKVVINGVIIGTLNLTTTVCSWSQFPTYVWNSGSSTSAIIQLFDTNVSAVGNDFALSGIRFITTYSCNVSSTAGVDVVPISTPIIVSGASTPNSVTFNWPTPTTVEFGSGASGFDVSYSINGGTAINVGYISAPTLSNTYTVNGLSPNDEVEITVTSVGSCPGVGRKTSYATACFSPTITCGITTTSSVTFNWVPVGTGADTASGYTVSYQINSGAINTLPTLPSLNLTVNSLNPGDQVTITVLPVGSGCYTSTTQTCFAATTCPVPVVSVTQQPTCAVPTGTIVFTSPVNTVLPIPSNLFISQVTDANSGALTYIEIYNGTGATVNLANYKIKIYNNGSGTVTGTCDFALSGNLVNNDVVVIAVGSAVNLGGVVPDLTFAGCGGVNNNDNRRLATIGDVEFDLWGETTGTVFTPAGAVGYSYTRNVLAPHPSMIWNTADWTATDWISAAVEDYSNVGTYNYQTANYQYSVVSPTYQVSPTFANLAPNTVYNVTIRDLVSGCTSTPIPLTVNPITLTPPPSVLPITYCQNAAAVPLTATPATGATLNWYGTNATGGTASATAPTPITTGAPGSVVHYYVSQTIAGCESTRADLPVYIGRAPIDTPFLFCDPPNNTYPPDPLGYTVAFDFNNVKWGTAPGEQQTSFTYVYTVDGGPPVTGTFPSPSHFNVPVPAPGASVTFTVTWNGICTPPLTNTCILPCQVTPVLSIHNPAAVCSPGTVDITAAAVTAGSTGGGTLSYWTNATATTGLTLAQASAISTSGTYYIKSSLGNCSDIKPVVVTINPTPALTITNPAAICAPSTVDIMLPPVTAGSTGGGILSYWINPAATTALTNPSAIASSGTYYIKSTVGTCFDIEPVTVTVNATPVLVITNPAAVCSPSTVNITLAAVTAGSLGAGILSYWTNAAATTGLTMAQASTISTSGTYYIKSTLGTCSDIKPVVVTITNTPVLVITNPAAVCSPSTVNITLAAVTAGSTGGGTLSYWTNATGTTGLTLAQASTINTSGTYYIKSTVGTCTDIQPVVVTISATPVLSITNPPAVCFPNTVDITAPAVTIGSTGGGILSYWTNAAATIGLTIAQASAISTGGTYYIKSTLGSCSDVKPVVVTINPNPVLNITNPPAVCSPNAVDITLPAVTAGSSGGGTLSYWTNATATSGLTLTQASAINTSGTYYIKSTVGTCTDIRPVVVTINATPVLSITNPPAVCSPNAVDITLPAVTAGSSGGGTLSYWTNAAATTGLTIAQASAISTSGTYYIKSTLGSCSDIEAVIVTINNPNLAITNPPVVCSPNTVNITAPEVTAGSTGGGTLSYWTDAAATSSLTIVQASAITLSGTYYIKSSIGTCFDIEPVVVSINANFVVNTPLPLESCDPNNDGFVTFDLTQVINSITGGNPGYTVSFHETQVDADVAGTSIPNPGNYDNINPFLQTVYIRVSSNTSSCYQVVQLQLIIHLTPVATEPDDYKLCDTTGAAGYETFDLTTTIPQILGSLDPLTHIVTFYTSQVAADSGAGSITNPASYINGTIDTEIVYIRIENTVTGCYDIVTLQLIVNPLPNATQPNYPQYSLCDTTGATGFEVFDLASKVTPILLGQTGMDVTFYPSLTNAQNNTNAITNLQYTNAVIYVQTLGIRITNQATGCYVISTIDIRVEPLPVLIPPAQPYTLCDENQDGNTTFDLTSLLPGLLNGITTYTVSFHETITDAENNGTTIPNPAAYDNILAFMQIIYVRAEDNITHCVSITPIELNVNPSPIAPVNLDPITVCDEDSNPQDAITGVDLTQRTADALAQQTGPAANYIVTYYTSLLLAQGGAFPIIPDTNYIGSDGETIWVRVEHNVTGCYNIGSFLLEINTPLLLTTPAPLNVCDADAIPNDQLYVFDLTIKDNEINQGTGFLVTYYPSLTDAQDNTNVITTPTAYLIQTPPVQTLGAIVTTADGCQSITTLDIRVLSIPTPNTNPPALAPKCDDNNPGDMLEYFDLTVNAAYIANS
ncbi:MAG: hypothetical protein V4535_02310, partial [Bacteroidota bacterium]